MRINIKTNSKPKEGDIRHKTCFAWFPTKIQGWMLSKDVAWIWLESYKKTQEYKSVKKVMPDSGEFDCLEWVTIKKFK